MVAKELLILLVDNMDPFKLRQEYIIERLPRVHNIMYSWLRVCHVTISRAIRTRAKTNTQFTYTYFIIEIVSFGYPCLHYDISHILLKLVHVIRQVYQEHLATTTILIPLTVILYYHTRNDACAAYTLMLRTL